MPLKKKMKIALAIGNAFVFLMILVLVLSYNKKPYALFLTNHGNVYVYLEVADTAEKRQLGLMYREKLEENEGMLFVFDQEQHVTFWMKNTKIPLDIIFISANGTINEIKENVQPCLQDPCPIYPSLYPSKYVIEVNAGFCSSRGITIGTPVELKIH